MNLAINGLGRIGRLVLRQLMTLPEVTVVAINDLADARTLAHLIKYDSVHGRAPFTARHEGSDLLLGDRRIPVCQGRTPQDLPFGALGAKVVLECTGAFTSRAAAALHLQGSVRHVLVSAPSVDADFTVVMGVNDDRLDPSVHHVISNADSTANCLAPMVKVLDGAFGVESGLVTTVHSYTNDQRILDLPHTDLRRARAASMSMIPTGIEATMCTERVLPHLKGCLDGLAVRIPTPDVSLTDLSVQLAREASLEAIHAAFRSASTHGSLKGYLEVVEDEIVSVDLTGNPASCIFDPFLTKLMTPQFVKVFGWYDNEAAYAARMKDLAFLVLRRLEGDAA